MTFIKYFRENQHIENHRNLMQRISIKAQKKTNIPDKEVYILIIGESARYDHFSKNGYFRDTSPNMDKMNTVISYSDVCTSGTSNRIVIPLLLTKADAHNLYTAFNEPSFISFFKKAGFETYWIGNTTRLGTHTPSSVFAEEADVIIYLEKYSFSEFPEHQDYDGKMFPILENILSKSKKISCLL